MPDVSRISPDSAVAYQRAQETRRNASARTARASEEGSGAESGGRPDSVSLSPSGQELSRLAALVRAAPEGREERVAALQAQVEADTYQLPDDETLAEAILRGG